jgi:signal transduction histidine kinase
VNLATYTSMAACLVGALAAIITLAIASAPGTHGLRYFSVSCALGALYAASNATLASGSYELSRLGVRFGLAIALMHGVSWFFYTARRDERRLFGHERLIVAGLVLSALVSLVPGLVYRSERWVHGIPALGITYLDARATPLGDVMMACDVAALAVLLVRSVRRFPTASATQRAETAGLLALMLTAGNDILLDSDLVPTPYLLDLGFLALVLSVGGALARRFVDNARELASAQEELIRKERLAALGEMSAVVAHEVRNPVAVIFNAAAAMRKNPGERDKLLAIVEEEAGRLKRMVTDLLDFARPASVHLVEEPLAPIIESALESIRHSMGQPAIAVHVSLEEPLPPFLCDVRLLRQALINLITNAIEAPGREGRVRITGAKSEDGNLRLRVADDGQGISEADCARIFRPFFTTRATGTGLGLAVVQRIVEAHGGTIAHSPTPGGGATFEIQLPAARASAAREAPAS